MTVRKKSRFAKWVSYYVMHVPKGSESRFDVAFDPVRICVDSRAVVLDMKRSEKGLDYLLGAKVSKSVILKGFDEIGRKVSVGVVF